ncbi:hypothetical protein ACO0RG_000354 [Hanseniaspora osmophila]|uniref:Alkylphosphocholine resistance protein LEM3 n=1 Tax=Hanseniaspora osmophila TaxID=56408 RepID=A0A1E5R5K0_9ASCO|nr:Alkylphosphocholine resistance protein LEM3 [Hanseniaspora osmophila]
MTSQLASKGKNLGDFFKFKNGGFKLSSLNHFNNKNGSQEEVVPEEEEVDASEFEDDDEFEEKKDPHSRRPKNTPFVQQRIPSYNPIFTPRLTLSIYLILAGIFILFGGILLAMYQRTDQVILYYQECSSSAPQDDFGTIPTEYVDTHFHKTNKSYVFDAQWKYTPLDSSSEYMGDENGTCTLKFTTPYELPHPLYMSYLVKNFYPNHRRYALSFNEDQINGVKTSISDVKESTGISCKVLHQDDNGKQLYPCGLIANAMFNDSFDLTLTNTENSSNSYDLTNKGISWSTNPDRFKKTKLSYDQIAPPPYWEKKFPNGYNSTNVPDISTWEEFQNWMDNPALPVFSKLLGKSSEKKKLTSGTYELDIELNWPVSMYKGKKAFFLTHGSPVGGYNDFLGITYLIGGLICLAVAVLIIGMKLLSGRKTADPSLLSWYKE